MARYWFTTLHSTDYVFDGSKRRPYSEDDAPKPANVYGKTKLAGEEAIRASGCRYLILRTPWVYSDHRRHFLLTMLRLVREKPELRIVNDQTGAPTWARDIASATGEILALPSIPEGLFHLTASGHTTWYGFAKAIVALRGLDIPVVPLRSAEYPTPAVRPAYSVLNNAKLEAQTGVALRHWEMALQDCMQTIGIA